MDPESSPIPAISLTARFLRPFMMLVSPAYDSSAETSAS